MYSNDDVNDATAFIAALRDVRSKVPDDPATASDEPDATDDPLDQKDTPPQIPQ